MVSYRSVGLVALGNMAAPVAAALSLPLLARALGVDARGEVAAATAPLLLCVVAATLGIPEALTFRIASGVRRRLRRDAGTAVVVTILASIVATALIFALRSPLAGGDRNVLGLIVVASLFLLPALLVNLLRASASGRSLWSYVAFEQAISAIVRLGLVVVLFACGELTTLRAVLVVSLAPVVGGVAYIPLLLRKDSAPPPLNRGRPSGTPPTLLSYGVRIWIGSISGILLLRLDQVLVLPLSDAYQLGLYVVAVNVAETLLVFNNALRDVVFVSTARETSLEVLGQSARLSSTLALVLAVIVGATSPLWFVRLFGADFQPAIGVTWVALAGVVIGTPGSVAGAALSGNGRPGLRSLSLLAACLVNMAAIVVFVPQFGAYGAAGATLIGNAISSNLNIFFARRVIGLRPVSLYGFRGSDVRAVRRAVGQAVSGRRPGSGKMVQRKQSI